MKTLPTLVERVVPEHMAWHEGYQVAVVRKVDDSRWVRWFIDGVLYEWPAHDGDEVVAIVGETIASDGGWRLL